MEWSRRSSLSTRSIRSPSIVSEIEEAEPEESPSAPVMEREEEEKVYVAVKLEVKESKANLLWAIENVGRGKIFVIAYVLQPAQKIPTLLGKLPVSSVSPQEVKAFRILERNNVEKTLDEYLIMCSKLKVRAEKVVIEANDIAKGIVELVAQHGITKLVIGAAADKHYSKKMKLPRSKTALSVKQLANPTCQIDFVCKGCLIFTREASLDLSQREQSPAASPSSVSSQPWRSASVPSRLTGSFSPDATLMQKRSFDAHGGTSMGMLPPLVPQSRLGIVGSPADPWEGIFRSSRSSGQSSSAKDEAIDNSGPLSSHHDEESEVGSIAYPSVHESDDNIHFFALSHEPDDVGLDADLYHKLHEALREAEYLKNEAYEESRRRRKAEMDAVLAFQKAKASENQFNKEVRLRKEIEEALVREKLEVQNLKERQDDIYEQLQKANEQKLELELKIVDSDRMAKDFEEKLLNARDLFYSLQGDYDVLKQERNVAVKEAEELHQKKEAKSTSSLADFNSEFSFLELEQATQNFSNSLKIGEGGFGSVYKGFLRNTAVAIKMLHPSSLQGQSEFHQEVAVLSRVRHPNLVTLIGSCSGAFALVYEFLPNGSLEDRLACKNNSAPLTWQVRTRIITEICSALIFLHSSKPPVVHGDLKPDNILLDANFVSKLGDFGVCSLLNQSKATTTLFRNTQPKGTFAYIDPEFMTTGVITPQSDVYSFGIIILRLLTGKPPLAIAREVEEALDNDYLHAIIDPSAGEWPFIQAKQLTHIGLKCCEMNRRKRPDLRSEVWRVVEPLMKSATLSVSPPSSWSFSDENSSIPAYFICPIFQEIMRDPHLAADGFTYEAEAIRGWIDSGHDTSPMTNLKLTNCDLIPNRALRSAIQEWYQLQQPQS